MRRIALQCGAIPETVADIFLLCEQKQKSATEEKTQAENLVRLGVLRREDG